MSLDVRWERVSERHREILRYVARPICDGYSSAEVAKAITNSKIPMKHLRAITSTMTPDRVNSLMRELRVALLRSVEQ